MRPTSVPPTSAGVTPWPPERAAAYVAKGYWAGRSLGDRLAEAARATPDAECLVDGERRLTYRELLARADGAAARLLDLGVRPDDRVVVQLPNRWEFVVLTVACLRLGVLPVWAVPEYGEHELTGIVAHAQARVLVVAEAYRGVHTAALARRVAAAVPSVQHVFVADDPAGSGRDLAWLVAEPADPAAVSARIDAWAPAGAATATFLLSGGTTGVPKLIPRSNDDLCYLIGRAAQLCEFDRSTVYLAVLPLGHGFVNTGPGVLGALLSGGRVVIARSPAPETALPLIERERVTATSVVPAIAHRWLAHRAEHPELDLGSLRVVQSGAARLTPDLARRIGPELGGVLQQVYGMGEGLLCVTRLDDPAEVITETQGRPVCPDDELRFVDADGHPVPAGTPGVLQTRGPYTPCGYYRSPELNAHAYTADGWYHTGDVVLLRPDGNLVVTGRVKDVVNRGGEKVSADEVEAFARQVPGVAQAAAVGTPDAELGEVVCLAVVPRPGASVQLADVHAVMLAAGAARFKLPARLVVLDALPLTAVGKVDKKALRAGLSGPSGSPAPRRAGLRAMADLATPMAIRVGATLRVADHVAAGRRTAAQLATATGTHPGALDRLMRHLVHIGLFSSGADGYATTDLGEQLRDDHPAGRRKWLDIGGGVGKGDLSFVDLAHSVRTGSPAYPLRYGLPFWDDLAADPGLSASFDELMSHHVELDHKRIAHAYDWAALGHLVDVGGGSGMLLTALLAEHQQLRGTVLDLPGPAAAADARFAEAGLTGRADTARQSFFDPLPTGAGGYLLSAVLHDWDDRDATRILRRCADAAGRAGTVLVVEAIGADGESPDTAMDLRMLTYFGGKERGLGELAALAALAGLAVHAVHPVRDGSYLAVVELRAAETVRN